MTRATADNGVDSISDNDDSDDEFEHAILWLLRVI